ncbi:MAG: DUF4177 domain-containing protein [Paracoccaceae bacterium]
MYEYKVVGAPERAKRARGARTRTDRVAHALQDLINAEAVEGWEYQRTDLLPVEERPGLFSRVRETHRAVLVFRRLTAEARRAGNQRGPHLQEIPDPAESHIRLAAESADR